MKSGSLVPPSLFTPAIRDKFSKLYHDLGKRAKPKLWKTGRNAGKVRVPGIQQLPFSKDELIVHVFDQIGPGMIRCPYCVDVGRGANLIDLSNFVVDHFLPVARVGLAAHDLKNLKVCCADCNNCKGKLTYSFFIAAMKLAYSTTDTIDRNNFMMCLRNHGATMQARFFPSKPKAQKETEAKQSFDSSEVPRNRPRAAAPMTLDFNTKADW